MLEVPQKRFFTGTGTLFKHPISFHFSLLNDFDLDENILAWRDDVSYSCSLVIPFPHIRSDRPLMVLTAAKDPLKAT